MKCALHYAAAVALELNMLANAKDALLKQEAVEPVLLLLVNDNEKVHLKYYQSMS